MRKNKILFFMAVIACLFFSVSCSNSDKADNTANSIEPSYESEISSTVISEDEPFADLLFDSSEMTDPTIDSVVITIVSNSSDFKFTISAESGSFKNLSKNTVLYTKKLGTITDNISLVLVDNNTHERVKLVQPIDVDYN